MYQLTIDEMIEQLEDARTELGGQAQIRVAYQRNYPLYGTLDAVTVPTECQDSERRVWLAVGTGDQGYCDGTWAWNGQENEDEGTNPCGVCGKEMPEEWEYELCPGCLPK